MDERGEREPLERKRIELLLDLTYPNARLPAPLSLKLACAQKEEWDVVNSAELSSQRPLSGDTL
jgi:hypothetical protein